MVVVVVVSGSGGGNDGAVGSCVSVVQRSGKASWLEDTKTLANIPPRSPPTLSSSKGSDEDKASVSKTEVSST